MGRQFETDDDDGAAKEVISASSPRLRQAPAHSRDDSFAARARGAQGSGVGSEQKKTKGVIALASGAFSEESKEEIQPDDATTTEKRTKVCAPSDLNYSDCALLFLIDIISYNS